MTDRTDMSDDRRAHAPTRVFADRTARRNYVAFCVAATLVMAALVAAFVALYPE